MPRVMKQYWILIFNFSNERASNRRESLKYPGAVEVRYAF